MVLYGVAALCKEVESPTGGWLGMFLVIAMVPDRMATVRTPSSNLTICATAPHGATNTTTTTTTNTTKGAHNHNNNQKAKAA